MSEHVRNVRPGWIAFGWFIAAALTALALLALAATGVVRDQPLAEGVWTAAAMVFGFVLGGFYVGSRVNAAPILHGVGIGLFSLIAWVLMNLLAGEPTGVTAWEGVEMEVGSGLIFLHTAAAVIGTRMGVRWVRRA